MMRASVRFALRCNRVSAIRPRRSAPFRERCAATWSNQRFELATTSESHTRAPHARTEKPVRAWNAR
eukprot:4486154-Lingulodinium_polyedra.AAC.1